jgi:prepilin-type N-terminal cleavage/methylation domain-containing protein
MFPLSTGRSLAPRGLTLIELLFAMSVMAFALLGVAGMFPSALRSVVVGGQTTKATALAQEMADMIRNDPFDTLASRYRSFDTSRLSVTCPVVPTGNYDADFNKKKWKCDIQASAAQDTGAGLPNAYGLTSVVCVNANGTVIFLCTSDLRRVTVTVRWGRQGEQSVTLTTYVARDG